MRKNLAILVGLLLVASSWVAQAQEEREVAAGYYDFELATVEVVESELDASEVRALSQSACDEPTTMDALDGIIDLNRILNVGAKVWKIIQDNKPVVESKSAIANALPFGVTCWETLTNWKYPVARSYRYKYKNGFGMTVVNIQFKVIATPGGQYKGRGSYLSNVSVFPETLDVAWGYKVEANATMLTPVNMGTELYPIAGMEAQINWAVDTPLKHMQSTNAVFVSGLGQIREL